jgi:prepilin-type N-terminal cleavage/methylation domain-containing protein
MKKAFTLIELLVVIAIIAILAAILFPVFAQVKAAAKKTQTLTYLKQINLASSMYSDDNDGILMRDHINSASKTYYWWGSWDGTTLKPEESYLYPYIKSTGISSDPVFPNSLRTALGLTGFGYNYAYLSPTNYDSNWNEVPVSVSNTAAGSPAETISFATAARINNWAFNPWKLEGSTLIDPPSYQYPGVHARHVGEKAIVAWLDGHANAKSVSYRKGAFGYGFDGDWYKKSTLGDIMNSQCAFDSDCQDFYYDLN